MHLSVASKIIKLTGIPYTSLDDKDSWTHHLQDGARDVVNKVVMYKPGLLSRMTIEKAGDTSVDIADESAVIGTVRRGGYSARRILKGDLALYELPYGIRVATDLHPVWYMSTESPQSIKTLPIGNVDNQVIVEYIDYSNLDAVDIESTHEDNVRPDEFPDKIYRMMIIFASMRVLNEAMNKMKDSIPAHSANTAQDFEGTTVRAGWERIRYLIEIEEDPELAGVDFQALGAEGKQWVVEYQWLQSTWALLKDEYERFFTPPTQEKQSEEDRR